MRAHEPPDALDGLVPLWRDRGNHVPDTRPIIPDLQGYVNPHRRGRCLCRSIASLRQRSTGPPWERAASNASASDAVCCTFFVDKDPISPYKGFVPLVGASKPRRTRPGDAAASALRWERSARHTTVPRNNNVDVQPAVPS
jgi:hypothetical protein